MNPTSALLFGIALAIAAFSTGWITRDWKAGADMAKHLEQAAKVQAERQKQVDAAAAGHEAYLKSAAARERVVSKEVQIVVEKPVYHDDCFDPDGMRLLSEEIAARAFAGKSTPAVPDTTRPYPAGRTQRVPVDPKPDPGL